MSCRVSPNVENMLAFGFLGPFIVHKHCLSLNWLCVRVNKILLTLDNPSSKQHTYSQLHSSLGCVYILSFVHLNSPTNPPTPISPTRYFAGFPFHSRMVFNSQNGFSKTNYLLYVFSNAGKRNIRREYCDG